MKKQIDDVLKLLTFKSKKNKAEAKAASHIQITEEQAEAYLTERYPEGAVRDFEYAEHEDMRVSFTVSVHCRNLHNHRDPAGFMKALSDRNPEMFQNVTLNAWDEEESVGWEEMWVTFRGESGADFHVSCYKFHRGNFEIDMSAGKHGGATFVTEQNLKELEAVIEAFLYVDSVPPIRKDV